MEFVGKDLEDIQRVAGLLNLTVDELLQQSRTQSQNATDSPPQPSPRLGFGLTQQQRPVPFPEGQVPASQHRAFFSPDLEPDIDLALDLDLDLDAFGMAFPQSTGSDAEHANVDSNPLLALQDPGTEVILLNPSTTWYDCDSLWGLNQPLGEIPGFDFEDLDIPMAPELAAVSEMEIDRGSTSNHADDASSDWALVSASPEPRSLKSPKSLSALSTDKLYPNLAPGVSRSRRESKPASESSSSRVAKKPRGRYDGAQRIDTHLTRQLHACVRCRMQRNRCIPDPTNPRGPCLTCQQRTVRMSRLPCLRYMVTDSTLFRTGLNYMAFYKSHPMVGPYYGDFHLERRWTQARPKVLCLGQVGAMHLKIELREFVPPAASADVDLKGRPMYAVPWAVADPDAVVEAMSEYIEGGITRYMTAYLDDTDPLVWNIFQAAYRASVFPVPNEMLRKTLRLWVACRFIESKWRCWSETGWADSEIRAMNPQDPFYNDLDSLPPYIDYQIASIIIQRILAPLRKDVLRDLQKTLNTHSPRDWFATFLTCFILLQNYEMQILFQRQFAERRRAKVQYLDMPLVRATNSGAKTILAHFHYCYKGQQLFTAGFNWSAPRVRRMARLDAEQIEFMAQCRDVVVQRASAFQRINNTNDYHERWWYTSQLFDHDWTPRNTLEHAPPADSVP